MRAISILVLVFACNSSHPPADPDAAHAADASPSCTEGPAVSRAELITDSVAYLRSAFRVQSGFDGGSVSYSEMWVSLGDGGCPYADWSALAYVVPIAPAEVPMELRPTVSNVAVLWALDGKKFVVFLTGPSQDQIAPWQSGRLPDSISTVALQGAPPAAIAAVVADVRAQYPTLQVMWLDQVGVLTVDGVVGDFAIETSPASYDSEPDIEAAANELRQSGLFGSVEWSGLVFSIPSDQWDPRPVTDETLRPECLRRETRQLRELGELTTVPGFAMPLGLGPAPHEVTCP